MYCHNHWRCYFIILLSSQVVCFLWYRYAPRIFASWRKLNEKASFVRTKCRLTGLKLSKFCSNFRWKIAWTNNKICRIPFALLLHNTVGCNIRQCGMCSLYIKVIIFQICAPSALLNAYKRSSSVPGCSYLSWAIYLATLSSSTCMPRFHKNYVTQNRHT